MFGRASRQRATGAWEGVCAHRFFLGGLHAGPFWRAISASPLRGGGGGGWLYEQQLVDKLTQTLLENLLFAIVIFKKKKELTPS